MHLAIRWSVFAGGKRLRPLLLLTTGEVFGARSEVLLAPACALEMIHTYSLIHDDLPSMDDDELRRGRPTCHIRFDEATAILAGDALQTLAFQIIAEESLLSAEKRVLLVSELGRAAGTPGGMVAGQAHDLEAESRAVTSGELEQIHRLKTAALIIAAARCGAIIADATDPELDAVGKYAAQLGLLFQITDDLLDITATAETLGKTPGKTPARKKLPTHRSMELRRQTSARNWCIRRRALCWRRSTDQPSPCGRLLILFCDGMPEFMSNTLIDLSHTVEHGMITYKGLPAPVIADHLTREASRGLYAPGTEFHIGKIEMVANTGTYLDSPFHRYAEGKDLAGLPLESLADLEGVVVRHVGSAERELERATFPGLVSTAENPSGPDARAITGAALEHLEVKGKAVLFHTGWDLRWRTEDYWSGKHPFLTAEAAEYLAQAGAAVVGIDSYNIDDTATGHRPAHSVLLAAGIPIVEHLRGLRELPTSGFRFFAVPVKVKNFGTFPVRAFAMVPHQ